MIALSSVQTAIRKSFPALISLCVVLGGFVFGDAAYYTAPQVAQAASVDSLNQQKSQLEQQAKQAEYEAKQQKSLAERAADRLASVSNQINSLQGSIDSTQSGIADIQTKIDGKNQEIAGFEANLRQVEDQQDVVVRELYIMTLSQSDSLTIFSNEPVSQREQKRTQFEVLKKSLSAIASQAKSAKEAVEKSRDELARQQTQLEGLRDQQTEQQRGLASVQEQQSELKDNAEAAQEKYESQAASARQKIDSIEDKISAELTALLSARSNGQSLSSGSGQRVTRGTVVGHEGSTGNSTGPHVHFECRNVSNTPINCQPYVNNGTLIWPVSSFIITQRFGETANSYLYKGSPHTGIDLAGPYGQPVYAPADGTVILNKFYGGYGNAVAIQLDNGLVVLLGHMTGK